MKTPAVVGAILVVLLIPTACGLKFAVIADPHVCNPVYEPNVKNTVKLYRYSEQILRNVVERLNRMHLDFVLVAGDLTKNSEPWNHETAITILNMLNCPYYVVPGNHDVYKSYMKNKPHWTLKDFIEHYHPWLFRGKSYYSVEVAPNVLLIGLNTNDPEEKLVNTWGGHISENQLKWLERTLENCRDKWIIILMHHSLLRHPEPWDRSGWNPNFRVSNAEEVLRVLERFAKNHNIVVFCGHLHTTDIAYWRGIYEVACPSLCTYPLAYRLVQIRNDTMTIKTVLYPNETLRMLALKMALKAGWTRKQIRIAEGMPWDRNVTLHFDHKIRNVILMIGDGMGFAQLHLTELTFGNTTMEHFNWTSTGYELTDSLSGEVTDSAAAGTALATGFKTYNGMISTVIKNGKLYSVTTLLELAQKLGKSTGLVTTTRITDATPAVFASHVKNRHMEKIIAEQLIEHRVNVLFGGGLDEFNNSTLTLARELGYDVVYNRTQLERVRGKYVLGLFAKSNIPFVLDRGRSVPSLPTMTEKAIDLLRGNSGFFLMVEGGRIDHACHMNDPASTVRETEEFDRAVSVALDFARLGHTVVIVTADHETGGLTLGVKYGRSIDFKKLKEIKRSVEFMAKLIRDGKNPEKVVKKYANITLTPEEVKEIEESIGKKYEPEDTLGEILCRHLGLKFATHVHSGVPVPLMIYGVRFPGFHHHVETSKLMVRILLFGNPNIHKLDYILRYVGNFSTINPKLDLDHNGVIDYNDVLLAIH